MDGESNPKRVRTVLPNKQNQENRAGAQRNNQTGVMNQIELSQDRRTMTIRAEGHKVTLRSMLPDGFTAEQLELARTYPVKAGMVTGQVDRTWSRSFFGRTVYVSINTGPPTWWLPRMSVKRDKVMVGWLRGLIAVSWGRALD